MEATVATRRKTATHNPRIVEMPVQRMAVVHTHGDPNDVGPIVMPALYGAVYDLKLKLKKAGKDFKLGPLRARWPDLPSVPKDQWHGIWGLPVTGLTVAVVQKRPGIEVKVEDWEYGTVAEVLHLGPFSTEAASVQDLHAFIAENGYEIVGVHEEEYLTSPHAKKQKTIIRYPVRKKFRAADEGDSCD